MEQVEQEEVRALKCGHQFCLGCLEEYLKYKIGKAGQASNIKCP